MKTITIYKRYLTKNDCYKSYTRQKSVGIQVHSTGANNPWLKRYVQPDDGRLGKNQYNNSHNKSGTTVCASAYIGKLEDGSVAIYQALPWDCRCWLSGSGTNGNANRLAYVGFEICQDFGKENNGSEAYFREAVMGAAVDLTAYLCSLFGVAPTDIVKRYSQGDALSVMDHKELSALRLASNHADIRHWLSLYGLTMDDFRAAVQSVLADGISAVYVDCDNDEGSEEPMSVLYEATVTCPGSYLNIRKSASANADSVCTVNRGERVSVLDDSNADWWRVEYNGATGYAMTHKGSTVYLTPDGAPAPDEPTGDDMVEVKRSELEALYAAIGALLEVRG